MGLGVEMWVGWGEMDYLSSYDVCCIRPTYPFLLLQWSNPPTITKICEISRGGINGGYGSSSHLRGDPPLGRHLYRHTRTSGIRLCGEGKGGRASGARASATRGGGARGWVGTDRVWSATSVAVEDRSTGVTKGQ